MPGNSRNAVLISPKFTLDFLYSMILHLPSTLDGGLKVANMKGFDPHFIDIK